MDTANASADSLTGGHLVSCPPAPLRRLHSPCQPVGPLGCSRTWLGGVFSGQTHPSVAPPCTPSLPKATGPLGQDPNLRAPKESRAGAGLGPRLAAPHSAPLQSCPSGPVPWGPRLLTGPG